MPRIHSPSVSSWVCDALVRQGFLEKEREPARADVLLRDGAYSYTRAFWLHVGALTAGGGGPVLTVRDPERQSAVRKRIEAFWIAAGAPEGWARSEAPSAIADLLAFGTSRLDPS